MFQATRAVFVYCLSPVHMGTGTAIGMIDNPIQRERHTDYPTMAGSGLKGAVRHHVIASGAAPSLVDRIFGPEVQASDHAGAISFSDAQLVAFPVRSLRRAFVYATSPTALARTHRALAIAGQRPAWQIGGDPGSNRCRVGNAQILANDRLTLESFQFEAVDPKPDSNLEKVAKDLAKWALPGKKGDGQDDESGFFRDKLSSDLVLLSDEDFAFFVRNATVVEPHVRISDATGTADEGGLFYTENLPPESLLLTLLMASDERRRSASANEAQGDKKLTAGNVIKLVLEGGRAEGLPSDVAKDWPPLDGALLQVGGDATTGRGQVVLRVAEKSREKEK
jgi:CRISPR-associated protein Cmr4